MSIIASVFAAGNSFVDDLLSARKWAGESITFSFASTASVFAANYGRGESQKGFAALNASQQQATHEAMKLWGELIALDITKASSVAAAEIVLGTSSMPSTAWAYTPSNSTQGGDIWLGTSSYLTSPNKGNYAYMTIMHEIGHALGLSHPHEVKSLLLGAAVPSEVEEGLCPCCGGALHGHVSGGQSAAPSLQGVRTVDAMAWSVMSYRSYAGMDMSKGYMNETYGYAQTPMARDIAAIQHLYGANYQTRAGDTVYRWNEATGEKSVNGIGQGKPGSNKVFETVWDGGGSDTFDFSNYKTDLIVDLAPGSWTSFNNSQTANLGNGQKAPGNVAVAQLHQGDARAYIENAIGGTGNDRINGNAADNLLVGGAGNDTLSGLGGRNVLVGDGLGNELSLIGLNRSDIVAVPVAAVAQGGDDTLTGGIGNDVFIPGLGKNIVRGGDGVDTLILDFSFSSLKITGNASSALKIVYDGGSVDASGIELLATRDGIFSLIGPLEGLADRQYTDEIVLLYRASLGRELDAAGLSFWTDKLENGSAMDQMALSLLDSPEFAARFGEPESMSDEDFLAVLYENVLGRHATQAEIAYWAGRMEDGIDRPNVLLAFAQSDENRALSNATGAGADLDLVAITQAQWAHLWA